MYISSLTHDLNTYNSCCEDNIATMGNLPCELNKTLTITKLLKKQKTLLTMTNNWAQQFFTCEQVTCVPQFPHL